MSEKIGQLKLYPAIGLVTCVCDYLIERRPRESGCVSVSAEKGVPFSAASNDRRAKGARACPGIRCSEIMYMEVLIQHCHLLATVQLQSLPRRHSHPSHGVSDQCSVVLCHYLPHASTRLYGSRDRFQLVMPRTEICSEFKRHRRAFVAKKYLRSKFYVRFIIASGEC